LGSSTLGNNLTADSMRQTDRQTDIDYMYSVRVCAWGVQGYRVRRAYIATQGPLADTVEDFWRMLWHHRSNIIVMLSRLSEVRTSPSQQCCPPVGH